MLCFDAVVLRRTPVVFTIFIGFPRPIYVALLKILIRKSVSYARSPPILSSPILSSYASVIWSPSTYAAPPPQIPIKNGPTPSAGLYYCVLRCQRPVRDPTAPKKSKLSALHQITMQLWMQTNQEIISPFIHSAESLDEIHVGLPGSRSCWRELRSSVSLRRLLVLARSLSERCMKPLYFLRAGTVDAFSWESLWDAGCRSA